jgi:hypothetical protein
VTTAVVRRGRGTARRSLQALYDELNAAFWAGRLPPPQPPGPILYGGPTDTRGVHLRRVGVRLFAGGLRYRHGGRQGRARGLFHPPGKFSPPMIRVLSQLPTEVEREVLLHEMAHLATWCAGHRDAGHGAPFIAELERLAALGEVWVQEQVARYRGAGA